MNRKFIGAVALLFGLINPLAAMPVDPLIGTWKVIDDYTGYYISDIVIRKNSKTQQYSAVITKIILYQVHPRLKCAPNVRVH